MSRTAAQFKKFARFEPRSAPLDDASLAARVRALTRQAAWAEPLPENQRIVFPGYKDLKEMSKARRELVQLNIGHGWPSYFRMSNARMMFQDGSGYQEKTHARLNAALARGELFVAFLTTYPRFTINHSVLIYKLKSSSPNPGVDRYLVYDPNHPESPRELTWSAHDRAFSYQKDWDFVGGLFAFIRFTANRCSKSDSLTRAPCQRIRLRPDQLRRPLYLHRNRCRRIRRRRRR
jgi:hypothetical protein